MDFTIECQSELSKTDMAFSVSWTDQAMNRYHVWLDENGSPEDTIYKNPPAGTLSTDAIFFQTRMMDLCAKTNKRVRDAILEIDFKEFETVRADMIAEKKAKADVDRAENEAAIVRNLHAQAEARGYRLVKVEETPPMGTNAGLNTHVFADTGDAYDSCQCDDDIKKGHVLVIQSEGVVGIADTWPIAITLAHGNLHQAVEGQLRKYLADNGLDSQLADAIEHARANGWELDPDLIEAANS